MLFTVATMLWIILLGVLLCIPACPRIFLWYVAIGIARDLWMEWASSRADYADQYRLAMIPMLLVIGCIAATACWGGRFWPLAIAGSMLAAGMWWAEGANLWGLESGVYTSAGTLMLLALASPRGQTQVKLFLFLGLYFVSRGAILFAYVPLRQTEYWPWVVAHADPIVRIPQIALIFLLIISLRGQMEAGRLLDSHAQASIPAIPQEVLPARALLVKHEPQEES